MIVSPHWEGLRYEFGRAFSAWHQQQFGAPVEFDWRDLGGTSDDLRFVVSEFNQQPTGIGIDLFFGGGSDPFVDLARRDLLQVYRPAPEILDAIPAQIGGAPIYDPGYRWYGVSLASFGILYNKRVLELQHLPVMQTWRDLAERAPVDSVGSGDPRNSGTVHMMYEMILQRYGWDEGWRLLATLAAKIRSFDRSATTAAKDVTTGNTTYTLAIDFYALTQIGQAGKDQIGFVLPADCQSISADGVGILRGAPHLVIARRFVDFCVSEPGQRLMMAPRGTAGGATRFSIERMSILPALYSQFHDLTLVPINPFAQPITFHYDARKGSARWEILNGLLGATLIDVHAELVAAYKRSGRIDGAPPVTEAEAARLAAGPWREPHYRQRTLIEWQRWAQHKYETLARTDH